MAKALAAKGEELAKAAADARYQLVAKLTDFGLCARRGGGVTGGTPGWMSPRQLLRAFRSEGGTAAAASDIWALGLVVARLVDGRVAAAAGEYQRASRLAYRAVRQTPLPQAVATRLAAAMPNDVAQIVAAADAASMAAPPKPPG